MNTVAARTLDTRCKTGFADLLSTDVCQSLVRPSECISPLFQTWALRSVVEIFISWRAQLVLVAKHHVSTRDQQVADIHSSSLRHKTELTLCHETVVPQGTRLGRLQSAVSITADALKSSIAYTT